MSEETNRRKVGAMERHIQTIALGLITAALVWVGGTLQTMYDAQIEQRVAMDELKAEVKDVRTQLAQLPTQREIDARLESINRRLDALEARR